VSGRPVDIVEAPDGTIFISDDFGGVIWRVASAAQKPASTN
jgi:glucose/arabinose dehydrogenase